MVILEFNSTRLHLRRGETKNKKKKKKKECDTHFLDTKLLFRMKFGTDSSSNLETAHSLKELDAGPLKFHFTPFVDKMVILTLFNTIMHFIYILFVIYLYLYPESFTFKDIYLFEIKGVE